MGSDGCMWGTTAVTEKEAERNKYGCKVLNVVEAGYLLVYLVYFIFWNKNG